MRLGERGRNSQERRSKLEKEEEAETYKGKVRRDEPRRGGRNLERNQGLEDRR